MRILVLTKNVLSEKNIQQTLQELGHEVFCSKEEFNQLCESSEESNIELFTDIAIASLTLTYLEVKLMHQQLKRKAIPLLPDVSELTKEQLSMRLSFAENELSQNREYRNYLDHFYTKKRTPNIEAFVSRLSKNERKVFYLLLNEQELLTTVEDICWRVWKREPNNSTRSQLSAIIKQIRKKLIENQMAYTIKTIWHRGYLLTEQ